MKVDHLTKLLEESGFWVEGIVSDIEKFLSGDIRVEITTNDSYITVYHNSHNLDNFSKEYIKKVKVGEKVSVHYLSNIGTYTTIDMIRPITNKDFMPIKFKSLNKRIDLD